MSEKSLGTNRRRSIGAALAALWGRLWHRPLEIQPAKKIAIVGNPNVGKSLVFNRLTGLYVTVSNYPGTTVEVFRGRTYIGNLLCEIVDTPGLYSLLVSSEEEKVARRLLMDETPDIVVHIVDAKNLERMLPLTLQLIEAGFRVVLTLNMMDEAQRLGLEVNAVTLSAHLGVPVVEVVATDGRGIPTLRRVLYEILSSDSASRSV
ncbi:MAG: 50S ribosome-binding GTPase [Armatimonadetes bacterium]|nr:50S ribosome-binding GTPase [Armatimonadota bacterium]MDW8122297.1 FeoB small GTPase domain-containing protein [Armatimonadota bacterium]